MAEELEGVKRTADPQHSIPFPAVRDDVLESEVKSPTVSETGPQLYAHSGNPGAAGENPESVQFGEVIDMPLISESTRKSWREKEPGWQGREKEGDGNG